MIIAQFGGPGFVASLSEESCPCNEGKPEECTFGLGLESFALPLGGLAAVGLARSTGATLLGDR